MILYLDTETPAITRGKLAQRPVCVQTAVDDRPVDVALWGRDYCDTLECHTIVGANTAFDLACLAVGDPQLIPHIFRAYDEGRVVDVLLDGKLLDIAAGEYEFRAIKGWNLQALAARAGMRIDKDEDDETGNGSWRLRFAALDGIPISRWPAGAVEYAAGDVEATRAVHRRQQAERQKWIAQGLDPLAPAHSAHAAAAAFALHLMQCQGVNTDPAMVEAVSKRLEDYLAIVMRRLQRAGLVRPDGSRDTRAAARVMVDACIRAQRDVPLTDGAGKKEAEAREKYEALRNTYGDVEAEKKAEAAAQKIAEQWHEGVHLPGVKIDKDQAILSGSRVLELYAEYTGGALLRGRIERLRQGYVLPLQARFDPLKETGRTSSSQPMEPLIGDQLQNHARASGVTAQEKRRERGYKDKAGVYHPPEFFVGLRECFVPPEGQAMIICDYPSAELHSFAQVCKRLFGYSVIGDLLNQGLDLHVHFGMVSKGLRYEDYDKTTMGLDRDRAKPANYGFLGGMGPDKFILYSRKGYGVRFTREEAFATKALWLRTFPDAREYLDWIGRQLNGRETFTSVHPITGFVRGGCYYASGANNGFQSLTAYGAKAALYEVTRECFTPGSPLWGCRPWNFPHDEIVAFAPLDRAHEAAVHMAKIMDEAFNRYHPDYPVQCEAVVAERWSKKAKPVVVDGRLVPWRLPVAA